MGVNTITLELWSSDSLNNANGHAIGDPPTCNVVPGQGVQWPQPKPTELANLVRLFDLVQSNGMHVVLRLINLHMEEQPPANATTWVGAVLGAIGAHPALEAIMFDGSTKLKTDLPIGSPIACGDPAEPPLWLGPGSLPARYIQWAIGYAHSLGVPTTKLSAEAIIGDITKVARGGTTAPRMATTGTRSLWKRASLTRYKFPTAPEPTASHSTSIANASMRGNSKRAAMWIKTHGPIKR